MRRPETIDLRAVGLSQEGWRELRLEGKALGVPMSIVAEVATHEWLRRRKG
jgi:hypothetical protein